MSEKIPFDEDVMTLIMGLGGPEEPGQHGRRQVPEPSKDTVDLITQIRDLCEEFLSKMDKGDEKEEPQDKDSAPEEDAPEEDTEEE